MRLGRDYLVRSACPGDGPFLRDMLYEAIFTPPASPRPERAIVNSPAFAKYVDDWGGTDDLGFLAIMAAERRPIGAAWLRRLTSANPGYGYIDDETPELSIAVVPEYRGRGIGTQLLSQLLAAAQRYPAISLSVDSGNPALALYRRLGFQVVGTTGTSLTMRLDVELLRQPPTMGGSRGAELSDHR